MVFSLREEKWSRAVDSVEGWQHWQKRNIPNENCPHLLYRFGKKINLGKPLKKDSFLDIVPEYITNVYTPNKSKKGPGPVSGCTFQKAFTVSMGFACLAPNSLGKHGPLQACKPLPCKSRHSFTSDFWAVLQPRSSFYGINNPTFRVKSEDTGQKSSQYC